MARTPVAHKRRRTRADDPDTLTVEYVDPMKLSPNPKNAKQHTDKQIDYIAKSMDSTHGSVQPILVDENMVILAGHGRWMAHKRRGDIDCPVIIKRGLTEQQKQKFLVADNQLNAMTGHDQDALSYLLKDLAKDDIDISDMGFSEKELDKLLGYADEAEVPDKLEDVGDAPEGFHELPDYLPLDLMRLVGKFELPALDPNLIPELDPRGYVSWMNRHRTVDDGRPFLHMFGRESTKGLPPERTLIGFYIDDSRFERVWSKLRDNTQRFINAGVSGLIMPDFTRTAAWPLPQKLWAVYRNYCCAVYWQLAGLKVVPNICGWDVKTAEDVCAPIPKGCPSVAVQLQTISGRALRSGDQIATKADYNAVEKGVSAYLEIIRPEALLVYGGKPGLQIGKQICKRMNLTFVGVENRAITASTTLKEDGSI